MGSETAEKGCTDQDPSEDAEDRALVAEAAFALMARAYAGLAREYEAVRPGAFSAVNQDLMRALVADLAALETTMPAWPGRTGALTHLAERLRLAMAQADVRCRVPDGLN